MVVTEKHYYRGNCRWICVVGICLSLLSMACHRSERAADYQARIGVAVQLDDRVCMAIDNAKLLPSATITLLEPAGPERRAATARALVIAQDAASCPGARNDSQMSSYDLKITSGTVERDRPLIALDARVPSVYAAHSFHACASADGIHLTAWDGAKPLEGHRLWKQYYFRSEDVENNCTLSETAP